MRLSPFSQKSRLPLLLTGGTVLAVILAAMPVPAASWVLDGLTGLLALVGVWLAGMRLVLEPPRPIVQRAWQIALALLLLAGIREFGGPWLERVEDELRVEDFTDGLVLLTGFVTLCLISRFDDMPRRARYLLWSGFLLHLVTAGLDLQDQGLAFLPLSPDFSSSIIDLSQFLGLQLYIFGALIFVGHLRWKGFDLNRSPGGLGNLARSIFSSQDLVHRYRYPRVKALSFPGGKMLLSIARFAYWFTTMSRAISDRGDRSIWRQLTDIFAIKVRHGLDAQAYYMFELYRPEARKHAGGYLTRYETKNGLFKLLAWQTPGHRDRTRLEDKFGFSEFCERYGIPHVPLLAVARDGALEIREEARSGLDRDLFVKPARSKGSRGIEVFQNIGPGRYRDESGREMDLAALGDHLADRSKAGTLLIQSRLLNHPGLAGLAEQSLAAIRMFTCLDRDGKTIVTHGMLRVITRLEHGWPITFEMGVAIDLDTGTLGPMTGDKGKALLSWWDHHPITQAPVTGRIVPRWSEIKSIVLAAHNACEARWMVGWDIALTPEGPILLEGNSYPDVDFPQRTHRCSIGDSPLGPPLYARLVDLQSRMVAGTLKGQPD